MAIELRLRHGYDLRPTDLDLMISKSVDFDFDSEEEDLYLPLWDLTASLI